MEERPRYLEVMDIIEIQRAEAKREPNTALRIIAEAMQNVEHRLNLNRENTIY